MNTTQTYSYNDIQTIKENGFAYELPEYTLMVINKISKQVGAPTYIKTPIFKKHRPQMDATNHTLPAHTNTSTSFHTSQTHKDGATESGWRTSAGRRRKKGTPSSVKEQEWDTIRNFETTKMAKANDECEKALHQIRSMMNKLSETTYDTIKDDILMKLYELKEAQLIDVDQTNTLWSSICDLIITTSCINSFYSKQYVMLLKDMYLKYNTVKDEFVKVLHKCMETFYDIEYVDPQSDYDKYCENNIVCNRRRSLATFIANMHMLELFTNDEYTTILYKLITVLQCKITEANNNYVCEELSEVIYCLLGDNYETLRTLDSFTEYATIMRNISTMKRRSQPSITNKVIFKFCDIMECIDE